MAPPPPPSWCRRRHRGPAAGRGAGREPRPGVPAEFQPSWEIPMEKFLLTLPGAPGAACPSLRSPNSPTTHVPQRGVLIQGGKLLPCLSHSPQHWVHEPSGEIWEGIAPSTQPQPWIPLEMPWRTLGSSEDAALDAGMGSRATPGATCPVCSEPTKRILEECRVLSAAELPDFSHPMGMVCGGMKGHPASRSCSRARAGSKELQLLSLLGESAASSSQRKLQGRRFLG